MNSVMDRRVLDKNKRTLGRVQDVLINEDGQIQSLVTHMNLAGLRDTIDIPYAGNVVDPTSDTFTLLFGRDEFEDRMAQILADTAPAAGADGEQAFSLRALSGAVIENDKGDRVGRLDTILFDDQKGRAEALIINLYDSGRAAVPFEMVSIRERNNLPTVTLTKGQLKVLKTYQF
jgi:sporulation protein YlmC with PRC-barrel domain